MPLTDTPPVLEEIPLREQGVQQGIQVGRCSDHIDSVFSQHLHQSPQVGPVECSDFVSDPWHIDGRRATHRIDDRSHQCDAQDGR